MKRSTWMPKTIETSTWTTKTMKRSTWTSIMKRSTCTSKTIGWSKSTYNCQEIDLENSEDRLGLFKQCRDYYDIVRRARRYTCLLHYCEYYEFLCTARYTEISGLCTFWYINFRVYELFGYVNFGYIHFRVYALSVLCYPTLQMLDFWKIQETKMQFFPTVTLGKPLKVDQSSEHC